MKQGGGAPEWCVCNFLLLLADVVCDRRIGLRFFSPQAVGGRGASLFNMWDCFIVLISVRDSLMCISAKTGAEFLQSSCLHLQAVIVWVNNDLCNKYSADDSDSFIYRVVKRLHIIVHIVRCIVGMCVLTIPPHFQVA
jgi:hypothetical protein